MKVVGVFAVMPAFAVAGGDCPFTTHHYNAENNCATCDISPWYATDGKCTCGPSAADWITKDQVRACPSLKAAGGDCPFTHYHRNHEGDCAVCDKSPWYDSDHKCTCGPSAEDWITVDQLVKCTPSLEATGGDCPFVPSGHGHKNVEGACAVCDKSPWWDSDSKCTCGPSADDWITKSQWHDCTLGALEATGGDCPFTTHHYNAENNCAVCDISPWYATDKKCTCGPSAADWITEDQVRACPSLEAAGGDCPFTKYHYNAEGNCATCDISPWYATDAKCTCGPSAADWITSDQVRACPSLEVAGGDCPFTKYHYNAEGNCATCDISPWYATDGKCTCGPSAADWITKDQVRACPSLKAAGGDCPFTTHHYNAENNCATCDISPWYATDKKCTCGPSAADWITKDQVRACPTVGAFEV